LPANNPTYEIEAVLPKEYERLIEDVEVELTSEEHSVVPAADRGVSAVKKASGKDTRKFERAELLGKPTHETANGVAVHIWYRNEKYLARGSYQGRRFGLTLGAAIDDAETALRNMLVSNMRLVTLECVPNRTRSAPIGVVHRWRTIISMSFGSDVTRSRCFDTRKVV